MKKISDSPDVDALLVELSTDPIAYAEDEGAVINDRRGAPLCARTRRELRQKTS